MLTSNVQLGYVLTRGGGGASRPGQFILPQPRISVRIDNTQILLQHLLQEYLVERDVNFISVYLRCLLQTFSWVAYWQGVEGGGGGKLSRVVYLLLTSNVQLGYVLTRGGVQAVQGSLSCPEFQRELIIHKFFEVLIL